MPAVNSGRRVSEFAAAIIEGIHFLGDDIGCLAQAAAEHGGLFEHRHFGAAEPVELAHPLERLDDMGEGFGFGTGSGCARRTFWRKAEARPCRRNVRERVRKLFRFPARAGVQKTAVFQPQPRRGTDVVSKEMYSFEDRGGALSPNLFQASRGPT